MFRFAEWMCDNRVQVMNYLAMKGPAAEAITPPDTWWLFLAIVRDVTWEVTTTVTRLQGRATLIEEQRTEIDALAVRLSSLGRICFSCDGFPIIDRCATAEFIVDLGSFCERIYESLPFDEQQLLIDATYEHFTKIINGLGLVFAQRDDDNGPIEDLPPVRPHELAAATFRPQQLSRLIERHEQRLLTSWTKIDIAKIEAELRQLKHAASVESHVTAALESCDHRTSFDEAWAVCDVSTRFPNLCNFCGGLASIFPNTATVESDFSVLGWEKDEYRTSLTDFSLEGIIHSKQFKELSALAAPPRHV